MTATVLLGEDAFCHIGQYAGGQTCGIGADDYKQRIIAQYVGNQFHKGPQAFFQLPNFTAGTSAVGGRVHDDGIVLVAAANFTFHELCAVFYNPAYRAVNDAGRLCIFLRPSNHALCCVNVSYACACLQTCNGSTAGVCKQVQYLNRATCIANLIHCIVPVCSLFREQTGMLKVHGLDIKGQILIINSPALGQLALIPCTTAGVATAVRRVASLPFGVSAGSAPNCLRVGTYQMILSPTFQLFAVRAVQYFKISPVICNPHKVYTS